MRYLVAIPVYNEAGYLPRVLAAVRNYASDIVVVNDGSTDETPTLLDHAPDVFTITHPENRGYGQSLIDAFAFADARGYDWIITMDCDEQHEPAQIPEFVAAMERSSADLISGSRYVQSFDGDDPAPEDRRRINQLVNQLMHELVGLELTDSFCGFKAHRVASMRRLALTEPGYAFPMQFWVRFARAGMQLEELPVRRIYRDSSRAFGGHLDDSRARLQHYLEVCLQALRADVPVASAASCCGCTTDSDAAV